LLVAVDMPPVAGEAGNGSHTTAFDLDGHLAVETQDASEMPVSMDNANVHRSAFRKHSKLSRGAKETQPGGPRTGPHRVEKQLSLAPAAVGLHAMRDKGVESSARNSLGLQLKTVGPLTSDGQRSVVGPHGCPHFQVDDLASSNMGALLIPGNSRKEIMSTKLAFDSLQHLKE
jgi:hypothetical protein